MKIKRAPNHPTLQKFLKRMPTNLFEKITNQIIAHLKIQLELIVLEGRGFTATTQTNITQKYIAIMLKTSPNAILQ